MVIQQLPIYAEFSHSAQKNLVSGSGQIRELAGLLIHPAVATTREEFWNGASSFGGQLKERDIILQQCLQNNVGQSLRDHTRRALQCSCLKKCFPLFKPLTCKIAIRWIILAASLFLEFYHTYNWQTIIYYTSPTNSLNVRLQKTIQ